MKPILNRLIIILLLIAFPLFFKTYLHKQHILPQEAAPKEEAELSLQETLKRTPASILIIGGELQGESPSNETGLLLPEFGMDVPPSLLPAVRFWKKIYADYDRNQVILHDQQDLDIVYAVLDFSPIENSLVLTEGEKKAIRDGRVNEEIEKIQTHLKEKGALEIAQNVRAQTGQKDRFMQGIIDSGLYLSEIERIFQEEGLPEELTRLVFVESMFQFKAHSRVGAAGLWQIMPGTGKKYLQISRLIDERYDPILSSRTAAKILKGNYNLLGSWPLAINAYNVGAGRMRNAVEKLGTAEIDAIIQDYDHPSYSFASRNFYPEYLAARYVFDNYQTLFGDLPVKPPLNFTLATLPQRLTLHEVAAILRITPNELQELNPSLSPSLIRQNNSFPAGTSFRVPAGTGFYSSNLVEQAEKGSLSTVAASQWHLVSVGETLWSISKQYSVDVEALIAFNQLATKQIQRGDRLRIPPSPTLARY
ncbi:MAG: transglycosylase SLT domain-containing protein [bacterium]|nr:transglycosylase SLT domain-containing protein [bacterium]